MPANGHLTISADTLRTLQDRGADSHLLRCRLQWSEIDSFRRYLRQIGDAPRVHPDMLPTQASGRWSTTDPPIINFPDDEKAAARKLPPIRQVFCPDPGTYWLGWDWDAVEARLAAAYFQDLADIEAFNKGWDIHTLTAAAMLRFPPPPQPEDPHKDPACAEWRQAVRWAGKGDRRRHIAKTLRYALQYGPNEYAVLQAQGVGALGVNQTQLLTYARAYLDAKPALVAGKARIWEQCQQTKVSRTFMGRRRVLWGDPPAVAREGLNHMIQGAVADMMNTALIALLGGTEPLLGPEVTLVYNAHDGAVVSVPADQPPETILALAQPIVERSWVIDGNTVQFPATWGAARYADA